MLNFQLSRGGKSRIAFIKRIFLSSCLVIFGLTSCYKNDIGCIQEQINQLQCGEIASIDSQNAAINSSIVDLKSVDELLNDYISALKEDGRKYEQQLSALTEVDAEINNRIAELQEYTGIQLNNTRDWTEATFATMVQLDSSSSVVAGTDMKVGAITASLDSLKKEMASGYEKAIKDAISTVENSMKKWVNEQFSEYYTIAQLNATLDSLASIKDSTGIGLDKRIYEQKKVLETAKGNLTSAYKHAIEEAISTLDGKISYKVATDLTTAISELRSQIDPVNEEIIFIKARLNLIDTDIEVLVDQIQSVAVIPQDDDGSVNVDDDGMSTICFDIKPEYAARKLADVWVSLSADEKAQLMSFTTKVISSQETDVPVSTVKTVSFADGELKIDVLFPDLSDRALASLQIVYGQSEVASEYFTLYPASKPKNHISPTSIAVLAVNPIYLTTGTQASIEFRVNPSNATFDMSGEDCQLVLDKVGTVQARSSYVTTPSNYKLAKIEYVFDGETEELKVGQYTAVIEDTGKSAEYDEMAALVLNVKDANGDDVQISSSAFEIIGKNFENLPKTGLPIVVINTPNSEPIVSKDEWLTGSTISIINPDMTFSYQHTMSVKGRGNYTWTTPKKPYALKLDEKTAILGMPKHKRWVLLSNWMDRTNLRNAVTFEISKKTGLSWTPRGQFVELMLNGSHMGNYFLCEQIKIDKNRVNISEKKGQIFELDFHFDEINKFKSARYDIPWMFKEPEEVTPETFTELKTFVDSLDEALYDSVKFSCHKYQDYIDADSFIDYWIVQEIVSNLDAAVPGSVYAYKDDGGKITAGPVWDFDYSTYWPKSAKKYTLRNGQYYARLFQDTSFVKRSSEIWSKRKDDLATIPTVIDSLCESIRQSMVYDDNLWPLAGQTTNGDEQMSFEEAVQRMKEAYTEKFGWMDSQINNVK